MSHYTITSTDAFTISMRPHGEQNMMVELFTRDLGRIFVKIQNGAAPTSKLRPHISTRRMVICDCVKGKGGWKLVGARAQKKINSGNSLPIQARLHSWLRLHLPLEAPQESLFQALYDVCEIIDEAVNEKWHVSPLALETFGMATLMTELGYLEKPTWFSILDETGISREFIEGNEKLLRALLPRINQTIREIHV